MKIEPKVCITPNCNRKPTRWVSSVVRGGIQPYCGICCRSLINYLNNEYLNDLDNEPVIEVDPRETDWRVSYSNEHNMMKWCIISKE